MKGRRHSSLYFYFILDTININKTSNKTNIDFMTPPLKEEMFLEIKGAFHWLLGTKKYKIINFFRIRKILNGVSDESYFLAFMCFYARTNRSK